MIILYSLGIFLIVLGCIILILLSIQNSKKENINKNQMEMNSNTLNMLKKQRFNISKTFYINDFATYNKPIECKKQIHIDEKQKKICLIDYRENYALILNFNEIIGYEVYENNGLLTNGGNLGGIGLGLFGANSEKNCHDLNLIIRIKLIDSPQIIYNIIYGKTLFDIGYRTSSPEYKNCIESLQQVVSFLEFIKNENSSKRKKK